MKKIFYLIICIVITSCKKEVEIHEVLTDDSLFHTIVIDQFKKNPTEATNISKIAKSVEYIPLQTRDSILIGQVKKLVVWNGNFYIWDQLTETIFCFDSEGQFLHKIQKQGQAPDEYPRISDFTIDMKNGNLCIYSDMAKAIYAYTKNGEFIKRSTSPFILSSFAVQGSYTYYYPGRLPNTEFYAETYPDQYRYAVMENDRLKHQQLEYMYNEKYLRIPLSNNNFSFYKDTMLLVEYLKPEVYSIDSTGCLIPRYRIDFTTNKYIPSFDTDIDLEQVRAERENNSFTTLSDGFFETSNYVFFNYGRGIIGLIYVNKNDWVVHDMGFFLFDDINKHTLPISIDYVDEDYIYMIEEPAFLIKCQSSGYFSPYLNRVVKNLEEFDNPVIIKIKLK